MKTIIGVMGSAANDDNQIAQKAREIGQAIAQNNCVLAFGAGNGLPLESANSAIESGGEVIGFSPAINIEDHIKNFNMPDFEGTKIFTGMGIKGRNVIDIRSCQGVIFISGRIGTLNEFTIAFDEGKVCGILKDSGGMSDMIEQIVETSENFGKSPKGAIIYDSDPKKLVEKVIEALEN